MKIEIHVLQNFASSNLNRDDTGTPKDCELGGVRRARVSSQCLKRAMRDAFETHALVPPEHRAARTKRLVERVATIVAEKPGVELDRAERAVATALAGAKITADPKKEWKTQYLLFVPSRLVQELAEIVVAHLDELAPKLGTEKSGATSTEAAPPEAASVAVEGGGKRAPKTTAKKTKADAKGAVPDEVVKAVEKLLADGGRTPELALFGRMIADEPKWNVDAACQVAHAVSTHRVSMEFDFYTAIDDLKKNDTAGSDMMGTISFNSACFYRYLVVDTDALTKNLGADEPAKAQARDTLAALVRAAVLAIPTGKQNSMAAHNLPSFVLVDVREGAESRSLTNAFVDPVRPKPGESGDLVSQSIDKLGRHLSALEKVYGTKGRKDLSFVLVDESEDVGKAFVKHTSAKNRGSLDALIGASVEAAFGGVA
jgi:CRISPR system Cascade subunit CasC